ncbi:DUF771 domain-containing protein [Streptococcus sp. zg-JUN1979]|uniref:DUF771 domain-containing protein n=1 Tax=Streptococcus sp. zg-JUN1979 TaxID=3391450 RepID=UPI0039A6957A
MESQVISVQLPTVSIPIPDDMILIDRVEYEDLKQKASEIWWDMNDILEKLSISRSHFQETVLLNPKYRDKIDIDRNPIDGFVCYPEKQGNKYLFLKSKAKVFFEENFVEIFKRV